MTTLSNISVSPGQFNDDGQCLRHIVIEVTSIFRFIIKLILIRIIMRLAC